MTQGNHFTAPLSMSAGGAHGGQSIGETDTQDGISGGPAGTEGATSGQGIDQGGQGVAPGGNQQKAPEQGGVPGPSGPAAAGRKRKDGQGR